MILQSIKEINRLKGKGISNIYSNSPVLNFHQCSFNGSFGDQLSEVLKILTFPVS